MGFRVYSGCQWSFTILIPHWFSVYRFLGVCREFYQWYNSKLAKSDMLFQISNMYTTILLPQGLGSELAVSGTIKSTHAKRICHQLIEVSYFFKFHYNYICSNQYELQTFKISRSDMLFQISNMYTTIISLRNKNLHYPFGYK